MPPFHSRQEASAAHLCGCALLPLRTSFAGPAPSSRSILGEDIVDEALRGFRWNILFRSFEVAGGVDRVLVYLTLWIQKCLGVASTSGNPEEVRRQLETLAASDTFPGPGDVGFALASLIPTGATLQETQAARGYLKQLRQETLVRFLPLLYPDGRPNKWWLQFARRRFMNLSL